MKKTVNIQKGFDNMNVLDTIGTDQIKTDVPEFRTGDTVRIQVRVREGEKERLQMFQGVVIQRSGSGIAETFTPARFCAGCAD